MKKIALLAWSVCAVHLLGAQDRKKEVSATLGFVVNYAEPGSGFQEYTYGGHLGFNLYSREAKRLKTDLQVSMNLSAGDFSSRFLSVNALYGGRYSITPPGNKTSVFANALLGGVFIAESGDDFIDNRLGLGYSAGIFVALNRFLLGVSAESFNAVVFKAGYTF